MRNLNIFLTISLIPRTTDPRIIASVIARCKSTTCISSSHAREKEMLFHIQSCNAKSLIIAITFIADARDASAGKYKCYD